MASDYYVSVTEGRARVEFVFAFITVLPQTTEHRKTLGSTVEEPHVEMGGAAWKRGTGGSLSRDTEGSVSAVGDQHREAQGLCIGSRGHSGH